MDLNAASSFDTHRRDEQGKREKLSFDKAIEFLKSSLIYDMSLGSKELFHSNVWGFLMKNDHDFIQVFYPSFLPSNYYDEKIEVSREWHHRDVAIWLPKKDGTKSFIVIENKIKSMPNYGQLEEYTEPYSDWAFERGVLTGIDEECALDFSSREKLKGRWDYLSYKTIAARIRDIATKSTKKNIIDNLSTIKEYCDVLEAIDVCLNHYMLESRGTLKYDCGELDKLRIADVYKKMKGSDFLGFVEKEKHFFDNVCPKGFKTLISQSFHNGKTTLDVRFKKDDDHICNIIGVQLEGNQFRVCVQCGIKDPEWTSKETYSEILYNRFKDIWFDDSFEKKAANKMIFDRRFKTSLSPRGNKKYDAYATDYYCFIYQYFDIDSSKNESYDALLGLIKEFMSKAALVLQRKFQM